MHPSMGLWDRLFGEKVRVELPDGETRYVSKRWLAEMERQGRMRKVNAVRVHSIGKHPDIETREEFDAWLLSGGKTYRVETWEIGVHVTQELVDQWRDPETGDLYIYNGIQNDKWGYRPCTRAAFEKIRAIEESF